MTLSWKKRVSKCKYYRVILKFWGCFVFQSFSPIVTRSLIVVKSRNSARALLKKTRFLKLKMFKSQEKNPSFYQIFWLLMIFLPKTLSCLPSMFLGMLYDYQYNKSCTYFCLKQSDITFTNQHVVLIVLIDTDLIQLWCRNYIFEFESLSECYLSELILSIAIVVNNTVSDSWLSRFLLT